MLDALKHTFCRVVEAAHLHSLGGLTRVCLTVRGGNDGDLSHCGVEAGQQPAPSSTVCRMVNHHLWVRILMLALKAYHNACITDIMMNSISTSFMLLRDGVSLCDKKVLQHDRDAHYAELMLPSTHMCGREMC